MLANLPKWYRLVAVDSVGEVILEKRSSAIETVVSTKDLQFLFDCIRLYLDKPVKNRDFNKEFFKEFNASDGMFLEDVSDLEKRVLAGAIISEAISKNSDISLKIASVLRSAIFGIPLASIINIDIVQSTIEYLTNKAAQVRDTVDFSYALPKYPVLSQEAQTAETLTVHIKGLAGYIKAIASNIEKQNTTFLDRLEAIEEESNIHWWLFRSFCKIKNIPVAKLNPLEAPFILALELAGLFKRLPIPNNADAFLNKILNDVPELPQDISVRQGTEILSKVLNNEVKEQGTEMYGNLSPLYFAYAKAIESGDNDAWAPIFEKQTTLQTDFKCSSLEMSLQFLSETLLYEL